VPQTRSSLSRDQKVDEILELAQRRLQDGGYEALSIAGISRELGVAQNAIYWYFSSKDDLFVAALRRMLGEIATRKPSKEVGGIERILWFTDQFHALAGLRGAMRERARSSPVVAEFAEELDQQLSRMLTNALRDRVPAKQLPLAVETFRVTVEGTFVRGLDKRSRRRVLRFSLEQLMSDPE
jgi:AcrR family transcriptional regulator